MFQVDRILDRWLPRYCVLCGGPAAGGACCPGCCDDLPWIGTGCERCGRPRTITAKAKYCGRCAIRVRPARLAAAALVYEYPVDRLVALAKYRRRTDLAHALGELLADWLSSRLRKSRGTDSLPGENDQRYLSRPDAIVPIPLHCWRHAWRGYNQALDIARPVSARLSIPLHEHWCRRVRHTPAQAGLTGKKRRSNLRGAFVAAPEVAGLRLALIDDVMTTGSTAAAAAAACRNAGAEEVSVWTVARTV